MARWCAVWLGVVAALGGCAKPFDAITPVALPSDTYQTLTCRELFNEIATLNAALRREAYHQRGAQNADALGVLLVSVPVAQAMDTDREVQIAALKGQRRMARLKRMEKGC